MTNNPADSNETPKSEESKPKRACPKCGSTLDSSHLGEMCPACLLQVGFESDANPNGIDDSSRSTTSDDESLNIEDSLESVQKLFPGLEILERIGQGGMGIVYKARQTHLGRLVALKLLRAKCSGDPSLAERFTREARALAKLSHPNIVGVHDFGQAGDRPFLIMEYVDGLNLRAMLESKALSPVEAMAMVPAICEALQFAHDEGVVHRDIKPENILVDRRGRVRIADFGLARLMTRSKDEWTLTGTRQVMGTPHYMAPEQIEHPQEVDHRADIYSLGVVIYEMLTGELPIGRFELPSNKINVDIRFDDIVLRTLEKEPLRRYQHVTEVQTAVENIATDHGSNRKSPNGILPSSSISVGNLDPFLWITVFGIFAAAIVDVGYAFAMISEGMSGRYSVAGRFSVGGMLLGGIYHASLAIVLGISGWQLLNRGSQQWLLAALLAITPIHFGVLGGWPFGLIYLFLLIGLRIQSKEHNQKLASDIASKSQALNEGFAIAVSVALKYWHRFSSWFIAKWPVLWRRAIRLVLFSGLWLAFCAGVSASIYWFYGRSRFPTTLSISDQSAHSTVLTNSDEIRLNISSLTGNSHAGYEIKKEDLKRTEIEFALYLADERPDLRPQNIRVTPWQPIYMSQAFQVHFTDANSIEYEIVYPSSNQYGMAVEPAVFKSKPLPGLKISGAKEQADLATPIQNSQPYYSRIRNYSMNERSKHQYRPQLNDAKPIQAWLATSGMTDEEAAKNADGLYKLITELDQTGGIVLDAAGEYRLKPIADMLDRDLFTPQSSTRIGVNLSTQYSAIDAWIGNTVGVALFGLITFFVIKFVRMLRSKKSSSAT